MTPDSPRAVHKEIFALWLGTLLVIRLFYQLALGTGYQFLLLPIPVLFIYAPVLLCKYRGVDSYQYPLWIPAFRDTAAWSDAFKLNAKVVGIILIPWLVGYHYYQTLLFGLEFEGTMLADPIQVIGGHIFIAAIPEEFFYRGYVQTRLDEVHPPKWNVFGVKLGWGWIITCFIFAFGHSIVSFQWWHFAIFFPSLAFGWMRAKTGGVIAGAIFHAWCNITVATLDALYGISTI